MNNDGASQGVMPERALGTILGGEDQPTEDEKFSMEEFEDQIRTAPLEASGYDGTTKAIARVIVETIEKYPNLRSVPMESEPLRDRDGQMVWEPTVCVRKGLYDILKEIYPHEKSQERIIMDDLTGFMWGWAYNAAAKILGLEGQPNPAIVEIG